MPCIIKSKKVWRTYTCRKDWRNFELTTCRHRWRAKQSLKKYSNHKVRTYKGEISTGSDYRKIFDLQWTLY